MTNAIVRLLRLASIVICLIVAASFVAFAVVQTKTASGNQQEQIATGNPITQPKPKPREGSARKTLDEASAKLTSPFDGLITSSSEWATRGYKFVLALIVYGFGLGFLARVLRVRV